MKKQFLTLMLLSTALCACSGNQQSDSEPMLTKPEIQVKDGQFTPEIMHQLGKLSDVPVSNKTRVTANSIS